MMTFFLSLYYVNVPLTVEYCVVHKTSNNKNQRNDQLTTFFMYQNCVIHIHYFSILFHVF